jgi:hypothetical protein
VGGGEIPCHEGLSKIRMNVMLKGAKIKRLSCFKKEKKNYHVMNAFPKSE